MAIIKDNRGILLMYAVVTSSIVFSFLIIMKVALNWYYFENEISVHDRERAQIYAENCLYVAIKAFAYNSNLRLEIGRRKIDWSNCDLEKIDNLGGNQYSILMHGYSGRIHELYEAIVTREEFGVRIVEVSRIKKY